MQSSNRRDKRLHQRGIAAWFAQESANHLHRTALSAIKLSNGHEVVSVQNCTLPGQSGATVRAGGRLPLPNSRDGQRNQQDGMSEGKIKLTVVSKIGKEATIGILNEGDFFGEGCLTGQPLRLCSATAMTDCTVMRIDRKSMNEVLHREHAFSDMFVAHLLTRNVRYEEDLVDQLFNSSEKRLARMLLLLAHFGRDGKPESVIPKISQETLAEMVGTTRSRVSFFMNRFRKLGSIDYAGGAEGGLQVHSSLLNVVLHD